MKKNKIVAFAMAGALLVGGTFAGTKAWFTDEASLDKNIEITMGTLDAELNYEEDWTLEKGKGNAELKEKDLKVILSNAKPGDKISRNLYVANNGSLDFDAIIEVEDIDGLNVTLEKQGTTSYETEIETVEEGKKYNIKNLPARSKENGTSDAVFKVILEVPEELEDQNTEISFKSDKFINVKAEQKK